MDEKQLFRFNLEATILEGDWVKLIKHFNEEEGENFTLVEGIEHMRTLLTTAVNSEINQILGEAGCLK